MQFDVCMYVYEHVSWSLMKLWKAAIPKLWHYFSIFFTVDFLGKVNLLAHLQCLHFSHFCFNSISNTLKLFLLKPCHHLRSPNLMLLLEIPTYLALMLLSVHHSFLQFFFFSLPLPSPRPKHWWFRQFLGHLFHTFSAAHLWNVENTKDSVFSFTSWWSRVSLDVNCDNKHCDLGYISSVQCSPLSNSFNKFESIYWLSDVLGTASIEVI